MIVKFLSELEKDRRFNHEDTAGRLDRLKGHCFKGQEAMIVVDNMLRCVSYLFYNNYDDLGYKELIDTSIHELIHQLANWFPPEYDGLVYESPVSDLVDLIFEALV